MSSLSISFNQFVDLAVNPTMGTINTSLLHNLLHVIINQLQLTTAFVEFHGAGSAAIETFIRNYEQHCKLQINEVETNGKVDEASGNIVKGQKPVQPSEKVEKTLKKTKLFTIRNVESVSESPLGLPFIPNQLHSTNGFQQNIQTSSAHDDEMINVMPSNDKFTKPENSLKTLFDLINIAKRLDALEIGIRQVADIVRKSQCDVESVETAQGVIDPEIISLHHKVDSLTTEVNNLKCKCNDENFEETLFQDFHGKIMEELEDAFTSMKSEIENLKSSYRTSIESSQHETAEFKDSVCDRLESYKGDLINCMTEVQEMLDAKLDKIFVPDLKNYLQDLIDNLEEKIEKVDCPKSLAAGATLKVFKGLNCVSCGENVIQADAQNPAKFMLTKKTENHLKSDESQLQQLKLPSRLCGGSHTITVPRERVFRSENCQN